MRILVISNLFPPYSIGGYEEACRDMVTGLRERGHDVTVLTSYHGVERPIIENGVHRVLEIYPFWEPDPPFSLSPLQIYRWNVRSHRLLRNVLRTAAPDICYVWNMVGIPVALLTTLQKENLPIVFNIQDKWISDYMHREFWLNGWSYQGPSAIRRLGQAVLRRPADVLAPTGMPDIRGQSAHYVSHAFATIYHEKGWRFAQERVIYNGIDLDRFTPHSYGWLAQPCRLLFVGQLVAHKGAHVAIEALARIVREVDRGVATLTLVGSSYDRAYQERLRRVASVLDVDDLVEYRGGVDRVEMPQIYAGHDILLFPSSWTEGFSLALLEALASGLAVVGTTTGGSAEILHDEITGLAVEPEDAQALASQVVRLLDNPMLTSRLTSRGMAVVRERFDQKRIMTQVEAYLSEVAAAHANNAGCANPRYAG